MRLTAASFLRRPRFGVLCVCLLLSAVACGGDDDADEGAAGAAAHGGGGSFAANGGGMAGSAAGASGAKPGAGGASAGKSGASGANAGSNGAIAGASGVDAGSADAGTACNLACVQGKHCELIEVTCVRAPCPAQPMCVADASGGDGLVDCDPSKVLCKRATPKCAGGQVPSVVGSCYGDCVPFEMCRCAKASECPLPDQYTCHMSAGHCGPYVE